MAYVYLIRCDGREYIGMTGNLRTRLQDHKASLSKTTAGYLKDNPSDFEVVGYLTCKSRAEAADVERILHRIQKTCSDMRAYLCKEFLELHRLLSFPAKETRA